MLVNDTEYQIVRLLGHGKGGYSYLAEKDGLLFVLKQIHHEPCDYYTFGNCRLRLHADEEGVLRSVFLTK